MTLFVSSIWLYLILAIAAFDGYLLVKHWKEWPLQRKLTAMAVIALVLHVWEEWRIPGGFFYLYNQGSFNYPMSMLTDCITNMLGIVIGTIVVLWGGNTVSAITVAFCSFFEVVVHCGILMARTQSLFDGTGISVYYDPGMATTLCLFLPITIAFIYSLFKNRPTKKQLLFGVIWIFIIVQSNVILPEEILKDENSPYAFTDKGYYDQFDVTFPNDVTVAAGADSRVYQE